MFAYSMVLNVPLKNLKAIKKRKCCEFECMYVCVCVLYVLLVVMDNVSYYLHVIYLIPHKHLKSKN